MISCLTRVDDEEEEEEEEEEEVVEESARSLRLERRAVFARGQRE
jgi:hypothetical protein